MAKKKKKRVKKNTAKKAAPKKKVAKKATAKKKATKKSAGGGQSKSVDGIIKKFVKERNSLESKLTAYQKKVAELEARSSKILEEITKVSALVSDTENAIGVLDSRRDTEIGELLSKLGVQLGGQSPASPEPANEAVEEIEEITADSAGQVDDAQEEQDDDGNDDPSTDDGILD